MLNTLDTLRIRIRIKRQFSQPKSVVETLERTRALIENKENWTTYAEARDKDGQQVNALSSKAVKWCAVGALEYVDGRFSRRANALLNQVANEIGRDNNAFVFNIIYLNDNKNFTHQHVMEAFDKAIERAKAIGV